MLGNLNEDGYLKLPDVEGDSLIRRASKADVPMLVAERTTMVSTTTITPRYDKAAAQLAWRHLVSWAFRHRGGHSPAILIAELPTPS